jgi:hypothetical protein
MSDQTQIWVDEAAEEIRDFVNRYWNERESWPLISYPEPE